MPAQARRTCSEKNGWDSSEGGSDCNRDRNSWAAFGRTKSAFEFRQLIFFGNDVHPASTFLMYGAECKKTEYNTFPAS